MGGDCGRNPGIETGFKEDAVPVHLQLASIHIHALYLLNHKRRQVQGDERADFISRLENAKGDGQGPISSTTPDKVPPEPVMGFCILPRMETMLQIF